MSDDLVKRLRYVAGRVSDMDDHIDVHLGADRIEELEARLATCEKYRDAYAECDRIATEAVRDLEARLEKAEAERDGARKANREMLLEVLAASGQAQEAYEAQLAAEARLEKAVGALTALRGIVRVVRSPDAPMNMREFSDAVKRADRVIAELKAHPK